MNKLSAKTRARFLQNKGWVTSNCMLQSQIFGQQQNPAVSMPFVNVSGYLITCWTKFDKSFTQEEELTVSLNQTVLRLQLNFLFPADFPWYWNVQSPGQSQGCDHSPHHCDSKSRPGLKSQGLRQGSLWSQQQRSEQASDRHWPLLLTKQTAD